VRVEEARQLADRLTTIQKHGLKTEIISRVGPAAEIPRGRRARAPRRADRRRDPRPHRDLAFLLGSVATETLRHAPCDVLVCRGPSPQLPFQRPIVATDFSPAASKALAHAARVTAPGAPIEVVHAWQLPAGSWGATLLGQARFPWNTVRDAVLAGAKTQADKVVKEAEGLGHPIHVELVQGPPTSVITHAAEHGGHDLIAVGAHGKRGSVACCSAASPRARIRHAPCSVLVVHGAVPD